MYTASGYPDCSADQALRRSWVQGAAIQSGGPGWGRVLGMEEGWVLPGGLASSLKNWKGAQQWDFWHLFLELNIILGYAPRKKGFLTNSKHLVTEVKS